MRKCFDCYICARIIITEGEKILMGFEPRRYGHGGNHWETPGGSVNPGENILNALKREAKEEIGIKISIKDKLPFLFSYKGESLDKKFKGSSGIVMYFECSALSKPNLKKAVQKEFDELRFIGREDFLKLKKENRLMYFDRKFIPIIMRRLKKW